MKHNVLAIVVLITVVAPAAAVEPLVTDRPDFTESALVVG